MTTISVKRYDEMRAAYEQAALVASDLRLKIAIVNALGIELAHALTLAVTTEFTAERLNALEKWHKYVMADRTSAHLIGAFFKHLAEDPTESNLKMAQKIWGMRLEYAFSDYQMYADDALVKLGLARRSGDGVIYEGQEGF